MAMLIFLGYVLIVIGFIVGLLIVSWLFSLLKLIKINEGTGTAFKFMGQYRCSMMSLINFHFGADEFIVLGSGSNSTGYCPFTLQFWGWVLYISPFVEAVKYTDQNNPDGFGEESSVFLNQIQRSFILEKAETIEGEEIAIDLKVTFKMRVINIYLFLFIAPEDVIARTIEIVQATMSRWVKASSYETVQGVLSGGASMWDQLPPQLQNSIEASRANGLETLTDSFHFISVGLDTEMQAALKERKTQKLLTAARAQEVLGGMLENEALRLGLPDGNAARQELQNTISGGQERLLALTNEANRIANQRVRGLKPFVIENANGSNVDPSLGIIASLISLMRGGGSSPESPSAIDGGTSATGGGKKKPKAKKKGGDEEYPQESEDESED